MNIIFELTAVTLEDAVIKAAINSSADPVIKAAFVTDTLAFVCPPMELSLSP